jgi:hypothetical protein
LPVCHHWCLIVQLGRSPIFFPTERGQIETRRRRRRHATAGAASARVRCETWAGGEPQRGSALTHVPAPGCRAPCSVKDCTPARQRTCGGTAPGLPTRPCLARSLPSRTVVAGGGHARRRRVPVRPHARTLGRGAAEWGGKRAPLSLFPSGKAVANPAVPCVAVVRYHALSRLGFYVCHGRQGTTNISKPHNDGTGL